MDTVRDRFNDGGDAVGAREKLRGARWHRRWQAWSVVEIAEGTHSESGVGENITRISGGLDKRCRFIGGLTQQRIGIAWAQPRGGGQWGCFLDESPDSCAVGITGDENR